MISYFEVVKFIKKRGFNFNMVGKILEEMVREVNEVNKALGKALTQKAINLLVDLERCNYTLGVGEYDRVIKELKILRREFRSREKFYKPWEENERKFDRSILERMDHAYSKLLNRLSYIG